MQEHDYEEEKTETAHGRKRPEPSPKAPMNTVDKFMLAALNAMRLRNKMDGLQLQRMESTEYAQVWVQFASASIPTKGNAIHASELADSMLIEFKKRFKQV